MSFLDSLKIYREQVEPVLEPGESAVAATQVSYFEGREITGTEDNVVTFDVIDGLTVPKWNRAAESLISGVTLLGSPVSTAAEAVRAFRRGNHLVLTDRRLLALDIGVDEATLTGAWPLAALAEIRHDPRLGQHGRIRVTMTDGSLLRLVAGLLFWGAAKKLAADWRGLVGLPN